MLPPSLVPIRIDVFNQEKSIRIVDTLLLDPNLWPIPWPYTSAVTDDTSLDTAVFRGPWIESNCQLLANQVLADQECVGMGRTARFFTGRVELWSAAMQKLLADQIRPQLLQVASGQHEISWKRPLDTLSSTKEVSVEPMEKKAKTDATDVDTPEKEAPCATTGTKEAPTTKEEEGSKEETKPETTAKAHPPESVESKDTSHLIPMRLRLSVHGVRIHDDFHYDPALGVNPLTIAQAMGRDLSLADEAVVAIAIDIAEQVQGLKITDVPQEERDEGGPTDKRNVSAAWHLPERVHITNVAHLVAQHRHK